jgi:hypothetical protein
MKHTTVIFGSLAALLVGGGALYYHHTLAVKTGTTGGFNKGTNPAPGGASSAKDQMQAMINRILSSSDWQASRSGWKAQNLTLPQLHDLIFMQAKANTAAGQSGANIGITADYTYPGIETLVGTGVPPTGSTTGSATTDYENYLVSAGIAAASGGANVGADVTALNNIYNVGKDFLKSLGF